jgi:hypothetical protein
MSVLSRPERTLGRLAIPNLSLYLIVGQVLVYFAVMAGWIDPLGLFFIPRYVMAGQWWRIFSFLLMPPSASILFIGFTWWMFYFMGTGLEGFWGTFRFNLYIFLGTALSVGLAFLQPDVPVTNAFIIGSVILAFAHLNPDFELLLFFILPLKIKWLAWFTWAVCGFEVITGGWSTRLQVVASVGNFLIFFGGDIVRGTGLSRRTPAKIAERAAAAARGPQARHRCRICGKTDLTNPELDFRYCSKCSGDECYCPEHIRNHEHVVVAEGSSAKS